MTAAALSRRELGAADVSSVGLWMPPGDVPSVLLEPALERGVDWVMHRPGTATPELGRILARRPGVRVALLVDATDGAEAHARACDALGRDRASLTLASPVPRPACVEDAVETLAAIAKSGRAGALGLAGCGPRELEVALAALPELAAVSEHLAPPYVGPFERGAFAVAEARALSFIAVAPRPERMRSEWAQLLARRRSEAPITLAVAWALAQSPRVLLALEPVDEPALELALRGATLALSAADADAIAPRLRMPTGPGACPWCDGTGLCWLCKGRRALRGQPRGCQECLHRAYCISCDGCGARR